MNLLQKLKKPFPVKSLKWRQGPGGKELVYIDARLVQERLDDVMGTDWQCKYTEVSDKQAVCNIGLKIDGEWIWRADGAGTTNIEEEKGMLSDAFKRAAVRWGIGKYLYVGFTKNDIPEWATQTGYDRLIEAREATITDRDINALHGHIEREEAFMLFDFLLNLKEGQESLLYDTFPAGKKSEMKRKMAELKEIGRQTMLEVADSLDIHARAEDQQGVDEIINESSDKLIQTLLANIPTSSHKYIMERINA
jgi:hypothetical protein